MLETGNLTSAPGQSAIAPEAAPPVVVPRLHSIRARLILAFVLVVVLPMSVIGIMLTVSGSQGERQKLINQLNTVGSYKEDAIQGWLISLKTELGNTLIGENTLPLIHTIITSGPNTPNYQLGREAYNQLLKHFKILVTRSQFFEEIFLMNNQGRVVLSTIPALEGQIYSDQPFFRLGLNSPYVNPPVFSRALGRTIITATYPVFNESGELIAVLGGRAKLRPFFVILNESTGTGETGITYMINSEGVLLNDLRILDSGNLVTSPVAQKAIQSRGIESGIYPSFSDTLVIGVYRWMPELQAALIIEQHEIESGRVSSAVLAVNFSVALAAIVVAALLALSVTHSIAAPIAELASTASRIAAGDLHLKAEVEGEDEISALALAFNSMTRQLRALIGNLEQRVAQRTEELQQRTAYLEASAEVSQAATSILDPNQLIHEVVELIRLRFNLYYTGLFLVDEDGQWAVLRAGTGSAGQIMLARSHRLQLGGTSMVGWAIMNARARIALLAGEDPVRLATPELPNTRSEAALPLRSRGQVMGALTVQSETQNAFDETVIAVLQTMADQVAVALDNARLFAEAQQALESERRLMGDLSRSAWAHLLSNPAEYSFRTDPSGAVRESHVWYPEMEQAFREGQTIRSLRSNGTEPQAESAPGAAGEQQALAIPIKIRGQTIGVLDTYKDHHRGGWTSQEVSLLETIAEQLAVALDSAQLFADSQQKAQQERLVSEATSRMRSTLDIDSVIKTAVDEIYSALNLDEMTVWLSPEITGIDFEPAEVKTGKSNA